MEYISTRFDVDSSNCFPFRARTDKNTKSQTQLMHAMSAIAWIDLPMYLNFTQTKVNQRPALFVRNLYMTREVCDVTLFFIPYLPPRSNLNNWC